MERTQRVWSEALAFGEPAVIDLKQSAQYRFWNRQIGPQPYHLGVFPAVTAHPKDPNLGARFSEFGGQGNAGQRIRGEVVIEESKIETDDGKLFAFDPFSGIDMVSNVQKRTPKRLPEIVFVLDD